MMYLFSDNRMSQFTKGLWKRYAPAVYLLSFLMVCLMAALFVFEWLPYWMREELEYQCDSSNGENFLVSGYFIESRISPRWVIGIEAKGTPQWSEANLHLDGKGPVTVNPGNEDPATLQLYWTTDANNVSGLCPRQPPTEIEFELDGVSHTWKRIDVP